MNEVSLATLTPGEKGSVRRVAANTASVRQRLLEMGIVKGAHIELVRFAPLGDPIEVRVQGYRLTLRRGEAASVFVYRESS